MSWAFPIDHVAVLELGRFSEGCLKAALFSASFFFPPLLILDLINMGEETHKFPVPFLPSKLLHFLIFEQRALCHVLL